MFAIGDTEWSGVSKLIEEMGELQQVLGKIMGVRGATQHWSGDLKKMLLEEMGDVQAAIMFVAKHCLTEDDGAAVMDRAYFKLHRFEAWQRNEYCLVCGAAGSGMDPCVCKK